MQELLGDLEAFARQCIAAERYAGDVHTFTVFECDQCGLVPFELTIEHHTGSEPYDFAGIMTGRCTRCGRSAVLFGITGEHRQPERRETPVCECGSKQFIAAMCERYEGEEGLTGFFDEGVLVGKCAVCGRNQALVFTD